MYVCFFFFKQKTAYEMRISDWSSDGCSSDLIEKLIVDALNKIAFTDDAQVMGGGIKRYGSPARIDISFECLNSADVPATPGQKRNEIGRASCRERECQYV